MLLILKEIYGSTGIQTDAQLPALSLQVCPTPNSSTVYETDGLLHNPIMGIDPTAPVSEKLVGPPPKSGFVKKSWSKRNRFNFLEKFHDNEGQDVVMNHIIAADQVDAGIVPDVNASSTNFNYWKSKNILQESLGIRDCYRICRNILKYYPSGLFPRIFSNSPSAYATTTVQALKK